MKKIILLILLLLFIPSAFATNTLISVSGRSTYNGTVTNNLNVTFLIYDAQTGGTLLYNETFSNALSNGRISATLGYQNNTLDLDAGEVYYMSFLINNTILNATINGTDTNRFPFISPVQADHFLNITNATITSSADDALVVPFGGMRISNFFNISRTSTTVRTNGTISILSLLSPALSINGFNISGANSALSTNGSILVNNLFNVTASNGNTQIGGTLRLDGIATFLNSDQDGALNISGGGITVGDNTDYFRFSLNPSDTNFIFTIKRLFNVTTNGDLYLGNGQNGRITTLSTDTNDALNVSTGGAYINGNITTLGNVTATRFIGDGSQLTGVTASGTIAASDYNWQLFSWTNYTERWELNITNIPGGDMIKLEYEIYAMYRDNGDNTTGDDGVLNQTKVMMVINNVSGTYDRNSYYVRHINTTASATIFGTGSAENFTIDYINASEKFPGGNFFGYNGNFSSGALIFRQDRKNPNNKILVTKEDIFSDYETLTIPATYIFLGGVFNTTKANEKLSEIEFFLPFESSGSATRYLASFNSSIRIYTYRNPWTN